MLYSSVQPDIIVGKTNNQVFSVVIKIRPNGYVEWEASKNIYTKHVIPDFTPKFNEFLWTSNCFEIIFFNFEKY